MSQERFALLRDMRLGGGKDTGQSTQRREAGNQFFLAGDLQSAMVNYTRAVVLGVENTPELASAFANRSHVTFQTIFLLTNRLIVRFFARRRRHSITSYVCVNLD